jgi:putative glycosyltransferase (TIGR04348 family)
MHGGKTRIVIVTPALADANNGNWQTARRWARMLGSAYRVRLAAHWDAGDEALLIALHARRSAASVFAWRQRATRRPLLVALTGTDLYRDIATDADAQASLQLADALVVLNTLGAERLPPALRDKCHVVLQSASARRPLDKPTRHLRALMVGHLREEKDPRTCFRAARRLAQRSDILLDHAGAALDAALGAEARALASAQTTYRWLGGIPHTEARRRIQAAHVLVHPSRMEGCWAPTTQAFSTPATTRRWRRGSNACATIPICWQPCVPKPVRVHPCSHPKPNGPRYSVWWPAC